MSENPYAEVPAFTHFVRDAFRSDHYVPVPDGWWVLVCDIDDSTAAVFKGRYEDVNFVGAACVAAIKSALPDVAIPTVFGGDGATALVPPEYRDTVEPTILALQTWSLREFELPLRIGMVLMSDIRAKGADLEMGKLSLSTGNEISMFRGTGLDVADVMIRNDTDGRYRLDASGDENVETQLNLKDLSCRWSPLTPIRGSVLCLIVGVSPDTAALQSETDRIYDDLVARIHRIIDLESPQTNPAEDRKLRFRSNWKSIVREVKARCRSRLFTTFSVDHVRVLSFHALAWILFKTRWNLGRFDPSRYIRETAINTDYIKVVGMVRMVLDCDEQQSNAIETLLESRYQRGEIVFGLFRTDAALITCITTDILSGLHLHYVDGNKGGFWNAAEDLKRRISASTG